MTVKRQTTTPPLSDYPSMDGFEGYHYHAYEDYDRPEDGPYRCETSSAEDTGPHDHGWWEKGGASHDTTRATGDGHVHEVSKP